MGYKHLNKPPSSGAGSSEYMYGSYWSGHRRSSVPNRAGTVDAFIIGGARQVCCLFHLLCAVHWRTNVKILRIVE